MPVRRPPDAPLSGEAARHLTGAQLDRLTADLRAWMNAAERPADRHARGRLWLVFLLLRFTGARLGEVLALDDRVIDLERGLVRFPADEGAPREAPLPDEAVTELRRYLEKPESAALRGRILRLDQGFVRRRLRQAADRVGLPPELCNPNGLRRARAVEMMRSGTPLTAVQAMLGHGTANLTASFLDVTDEESRRALARHIDRENRRRTSARNAFHGRIEEIRAGDVQAGVILRAAGGYVIHAVITIDSLIGLGLATGGLVTATVKAPWVLLEKPGDPATPPDASAGNILDGVVKRVRQGAVTCEVVVELPDATEVCAVVTRASEQALALRPGDSARVMFSAFSVILDVDEA